MDMFVKYKINAIEFSGVSAVTINVPIGTNYYPVDQSELINDKFVKKEAEKAINPAVDNEICRFIPIWPVSSTNNVVIKTISYNVIFRDNVGAAVIESKFSDIPVTDSKSAFINDDLKYRRNNLSNTYLNLSFYDEPSPNNGTLISTMELFVTIPNPLLDLVNLPVNFVLSNPILNPTGNSEGYYLYHYRDDVQINPSLPKELYMKAEFRNAKDGRRTLLATKASPLKTEEIIQYTYTRYLLKRTSEGYFYQIDSGYSPNIIYWPTNKMTIKLYELHT